ncbi:hypothetical protein [Neisseria zoodegmatis]|uniref:hypothetical protein n=1 Tax=Neisseria zoodegmatis TaxID=326523 RepID=UPI001180D0DB|nr:hypothetical protein [Neisseria zoodegmatis]
MDRARNISPPLVVKGALYSKGRLKISYCYNHHLFRRPQALKTKLKKTVWQAFGRGKRMPKH